MLAGSGYVTSLVAIDPGSASDGCLRQHVLVVGRAGVWGTTDAGADWYPMVDGLAVTIVRALAADPTASGRVYIAPADWGFLSSTDAGVTVWRAPPSKVNDGFDVAVDGTTSPGTVYLAGGQASSNSGGEIWSDPDPASGGAWTGLGLGAVDGGKRPLAAAVNRLSGGVVVLAAVDTSGIWRRAAGTWTKVNAVAMATDQSTKAASFSWVPGSSTAYLYDRETGVWRSNDSGQTWTQIWHVPSPFEMTGSVAADPRDPSRLFVSVGNGGLYRLDGATTGTVEGGGITPSPIGAFPAPGPIDVGEGGTLVATELPDGTAPPAVLTSADGGGTWTDITDVAYAASGGFARSISLGPDGTIWVGLNGDGMLVRIPPRYALSVATAGSGTGSVRSSPGGIDCGTTCAASFAAGTSVDLTATPDANSTFAGWTGDCSGTSLVCTISMTGPRTATATFALEAYPLSVTRSGSGSGTVTSVPGGIECGTACTASFTWGTSVTLTASPAAGSSFSGWGGDCSGTTTTCTVTMTAARSAATTFQPVPPTYQPDGWIKLHTATAYLGDGVYNNTGAGQTVSVTVPKSTSQTLDIAVQNDGGVADPFLVKGPGATSRMQVRYYAGLTGSTDITSQVTAAGYSTSSLAPGATAFIRLVVTVKAGTPRGPCRRGS